MAGTEGCELARVSESHKAGLSSDWSLQLDSMKLELLVIPDQHAGVSLTVRKEPSKVGSVIGVKS